MSDLLGTIMAASSGMQAQANRLRHVAENIANTDTPGYRRKIVAFELPMVFDPSHPMADDNGYYAGSNVDLVVEIADSREAQRSYEANLKVFDQARQMSRGLLDLLRK